MNKRMMRHILWTAALAAMIVSIPAAGRAQDSDTASGQSPFVQHFDQDGDGLVSADEFPGGQEPFSRLDINGDGYIDDMEAPQRSPRGIPGEKEMLDEFDSDGDGLLSADEFPGPADHFETLDSDGDGFLSAEELLAGRSGPPPGGGFESDDADQDGMVSQEEFSGPEDLFNHLDRNGDGFITRTEARAGHPQGRPGNELGLQQEQQ